MKNRRTQTRLLLTLTWVLFGLLTFPAACSPPQKAGPAQINIAVFGSVEEDWRPITISVNTGGTVIWSNTGNIRHSVISGEKLWDDQMLDPGDSFNFTFSKPGTFTYNDDGMATVGTIYVK